MGTELRVLLIEDSEEDAELLLRELKLSGYDPVWKRVETAEGLIAAFQDREWDVVIADYILPRFTGLAALELMRSRGLDLPFIIVSGKVGEDAAVEAMKAGAHDYLVKGRLARLAPAIKRELSEQRMRAERTKAAAELRSLKKAIETMSMGVTITDVEGTIIYTNPAEAEMHGYSVAELIGSDVRQLAPPKTWKKMTPLQLKRRRSISRESVNVRKDGTTFPVYLISNVVKNDDGEPSAIISTCENITQRKAVEATLRKQLAAMESSIDGMAIVDEEGIIVYANRAQAYIHGYIDPVHLVGSHWSVLYDEEEGKRIEREIMRIVRKKGKWRGEATGRRWDGSTFPQEVSLTVIEGGGAISVVRDITERKETEERLRYMSTHDPLTGFYNRAYFEEEIARLQRSRLYPVSIVMADVDGLKKVNDTQGHAAGDELLQEAARLLFSAFRAEDMVARIGGDEFVILLPEVGEEAAGGAVQRVRELLDAWTPVLDGVRLSLSLGMATARESADFLEALRVADERMYRDKLSRQAKQGL